MTYIKKKHREKIRKRLEDLPHRLAEGAIKRIANTKKLQEWKKRNGLAPKTTRGPNFSPKPSKETK